MLMKKLIVTSFLILGTCSVASAQPKIVLPGTPWDFGEVLQRETVDHQFEIQNAGTDTLYISRVKPSCGCTSAPLTKDVVAPGESIWIDITFDSRRFSGKVAKHVSVFCNDPDTPEGSIDFTAEVETARKYVTWGNEPVDLGSLLPDRPNQTKIDLTNVGTEPYRLILVQWPEDWMQTSWTEKVIDPGDTESLEIGTHGPAPMGKFKGSLTVDLQGVERKRMSIPITGIGLVE